MSRKYDLTSIFSAQLLLYYECPPPTRHFHPHVRFIKSTESSGNFCVDALYLSRRQAGNVAPKRFIAFCAEDCRVTREDEVPNESVFSLNLVSCWILPYLLCSRHFDQWHWLTYITHQKATAQCFAMRWLLATIYVRSDLFLSCRFRNAFLADEKFPRSLELESDLLVRCPAV